MPQPRTRTAGHSSETRRRLVPRLLKAREIVARHLTTCHAHSIATRTWVVGSRHVWQIVVAIQLLRMRGVTICGYSSGFGKLKQNADL